MMTESLAPHARCYARLTGFELACPWCDTLIVIAPRSPHLKLWDRWSGTLQCPTLGCRRRMALGVLIYSLARETGSYEHGRGADQVPTKRQLAEGRHLRNGGYWLRARQVARAARNLATDAVCQCAPLPWRPDCPIHGAARTEGTETGAQTQSKANPPEGQLPQKPRTEKWLAHQRKFHAARIAYRAAQRAKNTENMR